LKNGICSDLFASPFNKDRGSQEYVMHFPNFGHTLDAYYWRFLGDPIYNTSGEENTDFEAFEQPNIVKANLENFHDHFQPHVRITMQILGKMWGMNVDEQGSRPEISIIFPYTFQIYFIL
jgi:hypothetical protein